jgi:3-dehydroquinate dehydratase-2
LQAWLIWYPTRAGSAQPKGKPLTRIVYILNGPNLNLLGLREPEIYGRETLADVEAMCQERAAALGLDLRFRQSNAEHQIIDWLHEARLDAAGIIINPAALTHTSVAIHDALRACDCPIIELHLSNTHAREAFRHHSYVSAVASGIIAGCGTQGYLFALERIARITNADEPA